MVITYTKENMFRRVVWPLFIEPNPSGRSCYLIAWDQKLAAPRNYKVERISAVELLEERFHPPLGFSLGRHLAHAWGVWASEQPVEVEVCFSPVVARRIKETTWHERQRVEDLADGSVRIQLLIADPTELKHWVLRRGADCEVVAPALFRAEIAQEVAAASGRYSPPACSRRSAVPGDETYPRKRDGHLSRARSTDLTEEPRRTMMLQAVFMDLILPTALEVRRFSSDPSETRALVEYLSHQRGDP